MRPKYMYYLSSPQVGSEALKRNKGSFAVAFIHVLVRTKAHTHMPRTLHAHPVLITTKRKASAIRCIYHLCTYGLQHSIIVDSSHHQEINHCLAGNINIHTCGCMYAPQTLSFSTKIPEKWYIQV